MRFFRPYSTFAVGALAGVLLWPIVRSKIGSAGA